MHSFNLLPPEAKPTYLTRAKKRLLGGTIFIVLISLAGGGFAWVTYEKAISEYERISKENKQISTMTEKQNRLEVEVKNLKNLKEYLATRAIKEFVLSEFLYFLSTDIPNDNGREVIAITETFEINPPSLTVEKYAPPEPVAKNAKGEPIQAVPQIPPKSDKSADIKSKNPIPKEYQSVNAICIRGYVDSTTADSSRFIGEFAQRLETTKMFIKADVYGLQETFVNGKVATAFEIYLIPNRKVVNINAVAAVQAGIR